MHACSVRADPHWHISFPINCVCTDSVCKRMKMFSDCEGDWASHQYCHVCGVLQYCHATAFRGLLFFFSLFPPLSLLSLPVSPLLSLTTSPRCFFIPGDLRPYRVLFSRLYYSSYYVENRTNINTLLQRVMKIYTGRIAIIIVEWMTYKGVTLSTYQGVPHSGQRYTTWLSILKQLCRAFSELFSVEQLLWGSKKRKGPKKTSSSQACFWWIPCCGDSTVSSGEGRLYYSLLVLHRLSIRSAHVSNR